MAKILFAHKKRRDLHNLDKLDISKLLQRANQICQGRFKLKTNEINVIDPKHFHQILEQQIINELIERKLLDADMFICASYIASLIIEFLRNKKINWCAFDFEYHYAFSEDINQLKKGGDTCFIICSILPGRTNWRLMNAQYYHQKGAAFYSQYYSHKQKSLWYHMSNKFDEMSQIVNTSILSC